MINKIKNLFSKENIKAFLKETIETIIFVTLMVIVIRFFIGEIRWIPSGSMQPTLTIGDRLFIDRFSRFYSKPKRGDILVFYPPMENIENTPLKLFSRLTGFFCKDIAYIKRVIGLPGDKVEIKKNKNNEYIVLINDKPLEEDYILSNDDYVECTDKMYCGPMIVPDNNYFMMGDNRGNSQDSRFWGFLREDRIIGKAKFIFWPIDRIHYLGNSKFFE